VAKDVDLLSESEHLTVTFSRYDANEPGPVPHVHHEHTDSFQVLTGELRFRVGPDLDPITAGPGTFVSVPPQILHTFVAGDEPATFLNFHTPDGGFGAYMRKEADGFDSTDVDPGHGLPADGVLVWNEAI